MFIIRAALLIWVLFTAGAHSAERSWRRHVIDDTSRGADGVRLKDVNVDGLPDIATGWEEGGQVRVYLNPGPDKSQHSWPHVTVGRVDAPEDAVFVDLDGDGAVDVVSCCEGSNKSMYVHWAPTKQSDYLCREAWRTTTIPATRQRQAWMFALPLNMDDRNGVDLVVGSKGNGAAVGWLQAPEDPRRLEDWRYRRLCDAGWIMSLQSHDLDNDGDEDLLVSDRRGPTRGVFWLENPGAENTRSGANWTRRPIGGDDREVMFLSRSTGTLAGMVDVLAAVRGQGITVFRDTRSGEWKPSEIPMPLNCGTGKAVATGDIDLDGGEDIVFSCENAQGNRSGVRWLSQTDLGGWADHEISGPLGVKFDRLELLDLDGDGDLDVLTCEERENLGVIWYENPTR